MKEKGMLIEPPGNRTLNLLIKSQLSFKGLMIHLLLSLYGLSIFTSRDLYLDEHISGGGFNVDTKITSAYLNNKGGGTNEDAGGNR